MKIVVELEIDTDLSDEEIERDIRLTEEEIGWNQTYKILSVTKTDK